MKKMLATVSAVVLTLAMVAMPSVAVADEVESTETVTTETVATEAVATEVVAEPVVAEPVAEPVVETETATEPTEVATTQGELALGRSVQTTSQPVDHCTLSGDGWQPKVEDGGEDPFYVLIPEGVIVVAYCVKAANLDLDAPVVITLPEPFVGDGETLLLLDHPGANSVSHYQLQLGTAEPTQVTPDATFVDEVCTEEDVLVPGVITVDLTVVGVTYSITQGGNPVPFDAVTGQTGPLEAGLTYIVTATANTGYELTDEEYEEQFTPADESEGCGDVATTVTPDATFVDESCDVETKDWTAGVITVDLTVVGVTYLITQDGNPVPFDAVTGETGPLTSGVIYIVTATANTGYAIAGGSYEEQFTPTSAAIDCETLPLVVPQASQDPGCELPSSFTIGNDLSNPAALSWTANGNPIAEGTHVVNGPTTITLVATANGPEYGIADGIQREWTFTFPVDESCGDLETLALTGASDTTPALALTAFLGLLGLAMVRSGIRVNRTRQEA